MDYLGKAFDIKREADFRPHLYLGCPFNNPTACVNGIECPHGDLCENVWNKLGDQLKGRVGQHVSIELMEVV